MDAGGKHADPAMIRVFVFRARAHILPASNQQFTIALRSIQHACIKIRPTFKCVWLRSTVVGVGFCIPEVFIECSSVGGL